MTLLLVPMTEEDAAHLRDHLEDRVNDPDADEQDQDERAALTRVLSALQGEPDE